MKKEIEVEATPEEILYGDKSHLLYNVLYDEGYTVEEYLKDHMYAKSRLNVYERLKTISQKTKKVKFIIKIVFKNGDKSYTEDYPFQKGKDAEDFIQWCESTGIQHGIP